MATFDCIHRGGNFYIRASGFVFPSEAEALKKRILDELGAVNGRPFKVMFDLRGMKAVHPSVLRCLEEIDNWLYDSTASKIGTVFDSLIAKVQHLRAAEKSKARNEINTNRSRIFTNAEECRTWLETDGDDVLRHAT